MQCSERLFTQEQLERVRHWHETAGQKGESLTEREMKLSKFVSISWRKFLKSALVSLLALAIAATPVFAYYWDADNTIFTFAYQETKNYCGPASAWMYLNFIKNKYGLSITLPSQSALNTYGHSKNISGDPNVDPRGEAWSLYNYTPGGYYYDDWTYSTATKGLKGAAYTVAEFQEPIVSTVYGGMHFMLVRGVSADSNPYTNFPNATINAVYVADPWNPAWGYIKPGYLALGQNTYATASTWTSNYFTVFNYQYTVPAWTGKWVTVERDNSGTVPGGKSGGQPVPMTPNGLPDKGALNTQNLLPPDDPKAGYAPPVVSHDYDQLDSGIAADAEKLMPISSDQDIVAIAVQAVDKLNFATKPGFDKAFANAVPGTPVFIHSKSSNFPNYYLVPFLQDGKTSAVVMVGIKHGQGYFMESTYTDQPLVQYPFVTEAAAKQVGRQKLGIQDFSTAKVSLVWAPSKDNTQPFYPLWEVRSGTNHYYVDWNGNLRSEFTSEP